MSIYDDLWDEKTLAELEDLASDTIRSDIEAALAFGRELGFDYFGLGEIVNMKSPVKFERMPVKWDEQYPEVRCAAYVKLTIERSYELESPFKYDGTKGGGQ